MGPVAVVGEGGTACMVINGALGRQLPSMPKPFLFFPTTHEMAIALPQVLWPRDVFNGGNRGCLDGADARLLRQLLHTMHGTRLPPPGAAPPATITLQRKSANRRIVNEGEVVAMLREFGEVRRRRGREAVERS